MSSDCDLDEPILTLAKITTRYDAVPKWVLDCGAGCGKFSFMYPRLPLFRRYGYQKPEMVGVDIDRNELPDLRKVVDHALLASATNLPFIDNAFSLGFILEIIEHLDPETGRKCLKDMQRTCRKIIVSTPKDIKPCLIESHKHQWTRKELSVFGLKQYPHKNYLIFTNIWFPSRYRKLVSRIIPVAIKRMIKEWL